MTLDPTAAKAAIDALVDPRPAKAAVDALVQQAIDEQLTRDAQWRSLLDQRDASIADLKKRIAELEKPQPVPAARTLFGVNATSTAEYATNVGLFKPQVLRYYRAPGQTPGLPPYSRAPGVLLVYSNKIHPAQAVTGTYDAAFTALGKALIPGDKVIPWHEPEDDIENGNFTLDQYRGLSERVARLVKAANPGVKVGPCIMGTFTIDGGKGRNWKNYLFEGADFISFDEYFSGIVGGKPFGGTLAQIPAKLDRLAAAAASVGLPWQIDEVSVGTREGAVASKARNDGIRTLAKGIKDRGAASACWFNVGQWVADATAVAAWNGGAAA